MRSRNSCIDGDVDGLPNWINILITSSLLTLMSGGLDVSFLGFDFRETSLDLLSSELDRSFDLEYVPPDFLFFEYCISFLATGADLRGFLSLEMLSFEGEVISLLSLLGESRMDKFGFPCLSTLTMTSLQDRADRSSSRFLFSSVTKSSTKLFNRSVQ